MTPLQAAKTHCPNYVDGACIGVAYDDKLRAYRLFAEGSRCKLHTCEHCPWFEEAVLPQVSPSVAEEYRKSLPAGVTTTARPQHAAKTCLDCHKREVGPRQKYCQVCGRIRKREKQREHMRRKRGCDVEKLANSPIGAEALTKHLDQGGYTDTKSAFPASNFSTQKAGIAS
jgi:hypothetical protein